VYVFTFPNIRQDLLPLSSEKLNCCDADIVPARENVCKSVRAWRHDRRGRWREQEQGGVVLEGIGRDFSLASETWFWEGLAVIIVALGPVLLKAK
jgi:hypothetical protein